MKKSACVAVIKDEERYIAEWIAYQIAIGFDSVIIMNNNSTDRTVVEAKKFEKLFDVRILDSFDSSEWYQKSAYLAAIRRFSSEFEWMAFFDIDEFLVLDSRNIGSALDKVADAAGIGVSWAFFGSSGHQNIPNGLVIDNYRYRSALDFPANRHIKSIVRPELVRDWINGHFFDVRGVYKNLSNEELVWESPGISQTLPSYACGKLNHYFTRSYEDWNKKVRRGYPDLHRKNEEFFEYDRNEVFDDSAARSAPDVLRIIFDVEDAVSTDRLDGVEKIGVGGFVDCASLGRNRKKKDEVMAAVVDPVRPDLGGNVLHGDINTFMPTLWRFLVDRFGVESMLDVGCGEGHAVKFFHNLGVHAHGIEGLRKNLDHAVISIAHHDLLSGPYVMPVDLVWCCEVAEHIIEEKVDNFLDTLANGRVVAMTHALPGQDGHHHVNCQPAEYWVEKMASRGYVVAIENQFFRDLANREGYPTYFASSGLVFLRQR